MGQQHDVMCIWGGTHNEIRPFRQQAITSLCRTEQCRWVDEADGCSAVRTPAFMVHIAYELGRVRETVLLVNSNRRSYCCSIVYSPSCTRGGCPSRAFVLAAAAVCSPKAQTSTTNCNALNLHQIVSSVFLPIELTPPLLLTSAWRPSEMAVLQVLLCLCALWQTSFSQREYVHPFSWLK